MFDPNTGDVLFDHKGSTLYANLTDHIGTVRDLVNSSGQVVNHIVYDAFGKRRTETNPQGGAVPYSPQMGFTGQFFDVATGLQYNHHRWYDAPAGRWLSEDPIGFAGGDGNLYRYAGNQATTHIDPHGLEDLADFFGGLGSGPSASKLVTKPGPGREDPYRAQKFFYGLEKNIYSDLPNAAACTGDAAIKGLEFVPGGSTGVELGKLWAGQGSLDDVAKAFAFDAFFADEAQKLFRMGVANPKLGFADDAGKLPRDFATNTTKKWSSFCKSEGEARNIARTKLGRDPVQIEPGKWRSRDGKWQYRAKDKDLLDNHIHLEELDARTGELLQNLHLRWPDGASR